METAPESEANRLLLEISAAEARHAVAYWMRQSLAYGPMLSGAGEVSETAEPFFQAFSGSVRYFTNYKPLGPDAAMCSSKTMHTFDSGIVAVDTANIGMIWFAEED